MLRRIAGLAGLILLSLASLASAQSQARKSSDIRAGIVVIESAQTSGYPSNYTPHVWYNLDRDSAVKPPEWNIDNPRAGTQMTQATSDRWSALNAASTGGPMPAVGDRLNKSHAAYWEVRLSQVSDIQLSDYDVLLLSAYGFTSLNSMERDKLRKFVDQGGVLWIDTCSTTNFNNVEVNTFPLPFRINAAGGLLTYADVFHPLLMTPYALSMSNLEQIRIDTNSYAGPITVLPGITFIESWVDTDFDMHFTSVAANGNNPTVLVGKLGDGHVVVTTSEYAMALNRIPTTSGAYTINTGFQAVRTAYDRSTQLAARFAVNLINLSGGSSQQGGGARKMNASAIPVNPPLIRSVSAEPLNNLAPNQAPVIYKGVMLVSVGNQLRAYDAKSETDLDNDGNPDDGGQDLSLGQNYDLLWTAQFPATISAPACAAVPSAAVKDQVFVVDAQGVTYSLDVFALVAGRVNPAGTNAPIYTVVKPGEITSISTDTTLPQPGPYAPTIHDGLVYVAAVGTTGFGNAGHIWIIDPNSQALVQTAATSGDWYLGGQNGNLPFPTGSPTIGYIPVQDNSGAYDRVLYLPGRPTNVNGPTGTASVTSLWLGVRGESPPPSSINTTASELRITTRAGRANCQIYVENSGPGALANRALGVKLTVLHENGDPLTSSEMDSYFNGTVTQAGIELVFGLDQPLPDPNTGGERLSYRIDYSLDFGRSGSAQHGTQTQFATRANLFFPDDFTAAQNNRRRILGNIAMSPRGTIYCTVSNPANPSSSTIDCGSFYAIREDIGKGGFRLLTRYNLYPQHNMVLNQAAPVQYQETLYDSDPVMNMMPSPQMDFMKFGRFNHLTFVGGPTVRNGVVYVTASGRKMGAPPAGFVPYTVVMAFKAEPEAPEIRVGNITDGFSLRQYDIDRSPDHVNPKAVNDMSQGQFSYDRSEGVIRFDNLMTSNRSVMQNAFSTSQPVILKRTNQPDMLIDPGQTSDKWNPLLWYAVQHGVEVTGGPVTAGNAVIVPGNSVLPELNALMSSGTLIFSGMVSAWNGAISPSDRYLNPNGTRPWNRQYYQMLFTGSGPDVNPGYLWPSIAGLSSFDDYIVRVRQSALGKASTTTYGVVAGDGMIGAWGDGGAYVFQRADIIIADENRLGRFDAVGNPIWVINAATASGSVDVGNVSQQVALVRPVKAYPIGGSGDTLVVDTGGNKLVRIDVSGRAIRTIVGFKLNPNAIPEGFKANEPLTLNAPRDVVSFTTYELNGTQYWIHYLIADTGNRRLIELVDKYNVNPSGQVTDVVVLGGERQVGVLYWHSPTNYNGKDFDYNSVTRVYEPNSARYYYAAGIGTSSPTRFNTGLDSASPSTQARESALGNGGVVIFDPTSPKNNLVINEIEVQAVPQDTYWNFTTGTFNSPARANYMKKLSNINSVTSRVVDIGGQTRIALMITDSSGVYEVIQPAAAGPWAVRWMLPNEAYRALRRLPPGAPTGLNPMDLRATYARRLDNGDVMVVNGYLGKTRGGQDFNGEVLQINGDFDPDPLRHGFDYGKQNLGFDLSMIVFQLPPIQGARGLVLPVFADRR